MEKKTAFHLGQIFIRDDDVLAFAIDGRKGQGPIGLHAPKDFVFSENCEQAFEPFHLPLNVNNESN